MIELRMHPETSPLTRDEFASTHVPYSIALDGYVEGDPWFDAAGPRASFNHHEGVNRLATRATCAQVHLAIRQGLFDRLRNAGEPTALVYANDCDQDVCLAWYLLKNHYRVEATMSPALNRLVSMEDMLDTTAGAYPYPVDLPALMELAWIFEPYTLFRSYGMLDQRDPHRFASVVEDVAMRIDRHLMGQGSTVAVDTRFRRLGEGTGWTLVSEQGTQARTGLFAAGIHAFVSVRERECGDRFTYTVGRMSPFIPFDVVTILAALNEAESITRTEVERESLKSERWGGSDLVGGSPRSTGSKLTPDMVFACVDKTVKLSTSQCQTK